MKNPEYAQLVEQMKEIWHVSTALGVLHWDQEVYMPEKGSAMRAQTIGFLAGLWHDRFMALNKGKALEKLVTWARAHPKTDEAVVIREIWRSYEREKKIPKKFVEDFSRLCSESQVAWARAREKSDFKLFLPYLEKIVAMRQQEAKYVGYKHTPYDALLDAYEPEMTSATVTKLFDDLKQELVPLIKAAAKKKTPRLPKGKYPIEKQREFNEFVAKTLGFDTASGRLDISTHPFTIAFHPQDVRITTRYREEDPLYSVGSTVHETGHALYEQGLLVEHIGTPLAETVSLGIHESQSRVWENMIGKSRGFWKFFFPHLKKAFPQLKKVDFDDFMAVVNEVKPSLIRTEADEVTYNMHIILRFEMEKALIEGALKPKDVPKVWNAKMKEYLGIDVPDDRRGCLQDVHWSGGMIGYFPTYTLGNLYSAQLYATAKKAMPRMEEKFAKGDFSGIREWLRESVHIHGRRYNAESLIKRATGRELSSEYFVAYLKKKFAAL